VKLALIPPNSSHTSILKGTINLMLPWQLTDLPMDFIQQALKTYTILDNGAAEGQTISLNLLHRLVTDWPEIDELVLPDKLTDCETTRTMVLEVGKLEPLLELKEQNAVKFMAVAQGGTLAEIMSCINLYTELDYVDVIGLPRVMNIFFGKTSRLRMCEALDKSVHYTKPIHCLGSFYYYPSEARDLKWIPIVRSMDTSLPWVYGIMERYITGTLRQNIDRPPDYFNYELNKNQRYISERNARTLLRWSEAPPRRL
jgi:hypothetical protein